MSTSQDDGGYDYTEGASPVEINSALANTYQRRRKDSQAGTEYGRPSSVMDDAAEGAVFGGPGYTNFPSSVTSMHIERPLERRLNRRSLDTLSRGSLSRRGSEEHTRLTRRSSQDSQVVQSDEEGDEAVLTSKTRRRASPSSSPVANRSVFDNLAAIFTRGGTGESSVRRPSLSHRSRTSSTRSRRSSRSGVGSEYNEEDDEERWGYSSGEDGQTSSIEENHSINVEYPPSISSFSIPSSPPQVLPMLSSDPIFGDVRIDMADVVPESWDPAPPGPPSRQTIFLEDENTKLRFLGYETSPSRERLWLAASICSFGTLGLIGHWLPFWWLKWVAHEKAFKDAKNGFVLVETVTRDINIVDIKTVQYPYPRNTVFLSPPSSIAPTPSSSSSMRVGAPAPTPAATSNAFFVPLDLTTNKKPVAGSQVLSTLKFIDYRYVRFALDPVSGLFQMVMDWRDPTLLSVADVRKGLDSSRRTQRKTLFGNNIIDIQSKSTLKLLIDEIIHPFYVFQIASIILWSLDEYFYYAFCIALISTFSIGSTLIETKKTITRMREMSRFVCPVGVLVDGVWVIRDSSDLVPGDVVNLGYPQLSTFPADMLLLSGDAIVNESMLTGESVPVGKLAIKNDDLLRWKEGKEVTAESAKGFLYSGTRVVRIRSDTETTSALGLVVRTGFDTTKGALVRSMLYPKPMGFAFYRDSIRFIAVLALLAGLGFLVSAVQFIRLGVNWKTMVLRALDLITVVVPPALPATLSVGTSFAIGRLKKSGIFCISPNRINVAGKVNLICFDKTGTLTEDGLDVLGVRALERSGDRFGELLSEVNDLPLGSGKASFLYALTTCHSLKIVNGQAIGDPLDVKMFEFTGWTLEEGRAAVSGNPTDTSRASLERPTALVQTIVRPPGSAQFRVEDALKAGTKHAHFLELGVIKTYEFASALRRMSVIVKRLKSTSMEVYVKGAPEVMSEICDKDSFPRDYEDLLSYYTKHGYRVIAIAGKSIEGLSWLKAQRMKRDQAESGLRFLGLVIFENKLKPGTTPAIHTLREAHLACRMVTGDNPRTAVSVARECGLVSQTAHVFYPSFIVGDALSERSKLEWSSMDDETLKLDDYSLKPISSRDLEDNGRLDYSLVVSGDVFRWMINHAPLETLQSMLVKTQVFARMSPDEKHEIVERLQSLGYTVAFCGDGANDCGALKAADVGVSLSEAEASVAAPFTSQTPDISCMIEVIREGRAALVTSFSCFKYMALYSLIQFTTITLLYSFASTLGDFQFLYIDLFIIIPIAITMGRTLPYERIHHKRPTASLVSRKVLSSIIGQILITSSVQFWAFMWTRSQPWYSPPNPSQDEKLEIINYEDTVLFLVSSFQYIIVGAVFSIGPPYRRPMWTNGFLVTSMLGLVLFSTLVLLSPPVPIALILDLMVVPWAAKLTLLLAVAVNVGMSLGFERWCTGPVSRLAGYVVRLGRQASRRKEGGKVYKAID